jgi:thiol-disulfide isomerase/thioredoxin
MNWKEKWPAIAGIVLLTAALSWVFRGSLRPPETGTAPEVMPAARPARVVEVKERNGASRNLAASSGRILVVHFWATWCAPCAEEFPGMVAAWRKLQGRKDIEFVTVSVDEAWQTVDPWLAVRGAYDIPACLDPTKSAARAFGTEKFPETWVIGPDGGVLSHVAGPMDWTNPEVVRNLEQMASALPKKT